MHNLAAPVVYLPTFSQTREKQRVAKPHFQVGGQILFGNRVNGIAILKYKLFILCAKSIFNVLCVTQFLKIVFFK